MSRKFVLVHGGARQRAAQAVLQADEGDEVVIRKPRKSREQEEKYHAMLGDLAKQWKLHGRHWDADDMKRLCIDQFKRDTINDPEFADLWRSLGVIEMAPSIDGSGVVALGVQSRKFPKKLASGFVEWLYALGAEVGVAWSEPERQAA